MTLLLVAIGVAVVIGGIAGAWWAFRQPVNKPKNEVKAHSSVALLLAGLVLFQIPTISVDLSSIFSYASQIITMMMPIVGVGAGISFGFALVAYIIRLFRQVF